LEGNTMTEKSKILTERQRDALRQMANLEVKFGPAFLRNSLHEVRFTYQALERIAEGIDP